MRALGDIISDMEDLVFEMVDDHDMQRGDILAIVKNYIDVHCPESIEEYEDGSNPVYFYGPIDSIDFPEAEAYVDTITVTKRGKH